MDFFCRDGWIDISRRYYFCKHEKTWKNLWQLIHAKIYPNKIQLFTCKFSELNAHVKSMGSVKIHFEVWGNHLSYNNTCLLHQEQMCLKRLCFDGCFSHVRALDLNMEELSLKMKGSLSLNSTVHDLTNLLHYEPNL